MLDYHTFDSVPQKEKGRKNSMKKVFAILLTLTLVLSLGTAGLASGEASGGSASGEAAAEDTGPKAAIVLGDEGEIPGDEQSGGFELTFFPGGGQTENSLRGFLFTSDSSGAALLYSEPRENTADFAIGGDAANIALGDYPISDTAAAFLASVGVDSFDSAVILGDDENAASCPPVISAKGWTNLTVDNTLILAAGAARSAFYSDVSGGSTVPGPGAVGGAQGSEAPVVILSNSLLETTGGEISFGNSGGRARGVQPQGKSITYLYNTAIVSRTWGAWSTDSARQGLDFIAWRSLGLSQGGYGAYADTSCHVFLYGSTLIGSSDGIVASNNGEIYATDSADETITTDLRAIMGRTVNARDLCWTDNGGASGEPMESVITGGQTAVQFHMPDQGHSGARNQTQGTLYMRGGSLVTDESLIKGGIDGISAYNRHFAGACILTKSANFYGVLDGVTMDSWNGVLIHTMINSDANVNNIADGDATIGSDVTFMNMDVTGDIIHDDYQRELYLTLDNTTLTGAVYCNDYASWNALCEAEFEGNYILNPDGYDTWWGVTLTLSGNSVWNVTDTSVVTDLIINDGAVVNGVITENGNGTLTISPPEGASAEADEAVPATDGTENQANTLNGTAQPATAEEYDGYEAYLRDYMTNYTGEADGSGTFDEGARSMALGELDSVGFGADVNAFPFEMFVTVFGAMSFAEWITQ